MLFKSLVGLLLALCAAVAFAAVDINKATQADLESIKGIGPSMSSKILDERKKAPFKDWPDLIERVSGVGPGNAAKFSANGLTVNGSTFSGTGIEAAKAGGKPPKAVAVAEKTTKAK
jgi:competence protein ComEA